ncbi:MAG: hypothetical protein WCO98_04935, partial [bacterium]
QELTDLAEDDIVIVSDCDEIPRAEMIEMIKEDENDYDRYLMFIPQLQYKINYMKKITFIVLGEQYEQTR